ncbi:MAG: YncE family protein [candidate division WOR-3 bacterium]
MRIPALAAAVVLSLSVASGQWPETTIYLPNSFGGLGQPQYLAYNSTNNTIYASGEEGSCIVVIDGPTNRRIARVATQGDAGTMCHSPQNNKVYCANSASDDVTIVDGESNQVLLTISVGDEPTALCHNPTQDRLYTANHSGSSVSVLRGSGGSGAAETPNAGVRTAGRSSIIRGSLWMTSEQKPGLTTQAVLLDISGRKALGLKPGANDISHLAPGVYFLRHASGLRIIITQD